MKGLFSKVFCMDSGHGTGRFNMDCDIRLMQSLVDGSFQRALGHDACLWRFYGWKPAAVSLGYNQDPRDIDARRCREDGVDIVVRPTGGRAVFHADELTYSFHAETEATNAVIYRMVHEAIRDALAERGIMADFSRAETDFRKRYATAEAVVCFTASAKYELQVGGRKLVGSAQRRRENVILQHGSLPMTERHKEIGRYISYDDPEVRSGILDDLNRKTVSLSEVSGADCSYSDLVPLVMQAAGRVLGLEVEILQPEELDGMLRSNQTGNTITTRS